MKKTTKTQPSQAPATSSEDAPKPAPKTVRAPRVLKPVKTEVPAAPAPSPVPPTATIITAKVDVGFGNALYIRGEGPGLTWNQGLSLLCVGDSEWTISLPAVERPFVFKLLINDKEWSLGENFTAAPGSSGTFTPEF